MKLQENSAIYCGDELKMKGHSPLEVKPRAGLGENVIHILGLCKVKSTSSRLPLKLVYYEAYLSKTDAQAREKYLKGGGKAKLTLKEQIKESLK